MISPQWNSIAGRTGGALSEGRGGARAEVEPADGGVGEAVECLREEGVEEDDGGARDVQHGGRGVDEELEPFQPLGRGGARGTPGRGGGMLGARDQRPRGPAENEPT